MKGLSEENCSFKPEIVFANVDKKCREALESADNRVVNEGKVGLTDVEEAIYALKEDVSGDKFLILSVIEDHNVRRIHWQKRLQSGRLKRGR